MLRICSMLKTITADLYCVLSCPVKNDFDPLLRMRIISEGAASGYLTNVTVVLRSSTAVSARPPGDIKSREIISQECLCVTVLSPALKTHRPCSKSVKISRDCRVLCSLVSPLSVTKPCNQSLFSLSPPLYFYNHFPLPLSSPECQCDVKGTLSGVGDCQQVRIPSLPPSTHTHTPPIVSDAQNIC